MLTGNLDAVRSPYPAELRRIMNINKARESRAWLSQWNAISSDPTPLYELPHLAAHLQVASVALKDESIRSPLGSFKALGAPIALIRLVLRLHPEVSFELRGLFAGRYADLMKHLTVTSATDGNHGRALAAAAQAVGCRCVIVLHSSVSVEREVAIAAYNAEILRITGNYDDSVNEAARLATMRNWHVVSDTSYEGYEDVPRDVMQGYAVIAAEIVEQTKSLANQPGPYTHVILQGGVGGFAAGICSYLWEFHGAHRPYFIVVEPEQADCLYQSARAGRAVKASGSVDSVMAGLACGETSPLAWRFLEHCVDHFLTISDTKAVDAMRALAAGDDNDVPIVSGESGAAGIAALMVSRQNAKLSETLRLDTESRILCISTEGDTAPSIYRSMVGETAESVRDRQLAWMQHMLLTAKAR